MLSSIKSTITCISLQKIGNFWSLLGKQRYHLALWPSPYNGPKFTRKKSLITYEIWKWLGKNCKPVLWSQGFTGRVSKLTLTFDPMTKNQYGSSSHHQQLQVWKWLGINCSLYSVDTVSQAEWQSWPWPLSLRPPVTQKRSKTIGFLLSSYSTHMWSLKVIGFKLLAVLCPKGFYWPHNPKTKIKETSRWRVPLLALNPLESSSQLSKFASHDKQKVNRD